MSEIEEEYTYDLGHVHKVLRDFGETFIAKPVEFEQQLKKDAQLQNLRDTTLITYGVSRAIPILGSLGILISDRFRPVKAKGIMPLQVASANGAFAIYASANEVNFMKVALLESDAMEVEALALQVITQYVPKDLQKYFLTYKASCNGLVYKDPRSKGITLDLNRYFGTSHTNSFFGQASINLPNTVAAPMLFTRVVSSGISLYQVLEAWSNTTPTSDPTNLQAMINNMRVFHDSSIFEQSVNVYFPPVDLLDKARADIFGRLNDFIAALVRACAPLKLSHGDLHAANVLFDSDTNNFVMIDYGRVAIDLVNIGVSSEEVYDECFKIRSKDPNYVKSNLTGSVNEFYNVFKNFGFRDVSSKDNVSNYNIMLDLAGLAFIVQKALKQRLLLKDHPLLQIPTYTNTLTIPAWSKIRAYFDSIANTHVEPFDMTMAYLVLVIQAASASNLIQPTAASAASSTYGMDAVFGNTRTSLWLRCGQPNHLTYVRYKVALESLAKEVKFFKILQTVVNKKVISGGAKAARDMTPKKRMLGLNLQEMTQLNYERNMQEASKMSIIAAHECNEPPQTVVPYIFRNPMQHYQEALELKHKAPST